MPKILCISLTPLERDARVLRQIDLLATMGDVTTVGFGPSPRKATTHIRVPDGLATLPQTLLGVAKLGLRWHNRAECSAPAQSWVRSRQLDEEWDLVVANDARVLDLAFLLADGAPVWADMHEWAPEERTHITSWRLLVAPFMTYLCQKYLPQAALVTTVSQGIVDLYQSSFGVQAKLFTNAGPLQMLAPSPVTSKQIRCVHSGAAIHGRGLEDMIRVFLELPHQFILDLYLVSGGDGGAHLRELHAIAGNSSRITFHEPVAPHELPLTLSSYDVGIFWIPPTHTNARLTLPNKFYDYVQARLALAIGPSEEMAREVKVHGLGVVSNSFERHDLAESLRTLTAEAIRNYKEASDRAAEQLSFEHESREVADELQEILA